MARLFPHTDFVQFSQKVLIITSFDSKLSAAGWDTELWEAAAAAAAGQTMHMIWQ